MPAPKSLIKYLDKGGIKYEIVPHKKVYTAYDLAQTLGEKLEKVAKTVLVKVELPKVDKRGKYFVLVLPASYKVNFTKLKKQLKAKKATLVSEKELKKLKVKPGAVTPFGAYHKIGTLVDKALMKTRDALVSAGSHTDSLRVKVKDLHLKEGAIIGVFGDKTVLKLQKTLKKAKKTVKKGGRAVKSVRKVVKKVSKGGMKPKKVEKKVRKVVKKVKRAVKTTKKKVVSKHREMVAKRKPSRGVAKKKTKRAPSGKRP